MATSADRSSGRFWLSSEPDKRVGGWLDRSGRWPVVELAEPLVPLWHEVSRTEQPDGSWEIQEVPADDVPVTVHGMVHDGPRWVTLVKARDAGGQQVLGGVAADPGTQRLRAEYAIRGGHVDGAETRYRQVRMRFDHLDAWAHLPGVRLEAPTDGSRAVLTIEQPDEERVSLREPAGDLTLGSTLTWPYPTARGGRLTRSAELRWESSGEGLTTDEMRTRLLGPLRILLTLCVDANSPLTSLEACVDDDGPWLQMVLPEVSPASGDLLAASAVLLGRKHLGLQEMGTWLHRSATLSPMPRLVAEAVTPPKDRALESQLLDLAAAADGLHRRLHPDEQAIPVTRARQARRLAREAVDEELRDRVRDALAHLHEPTYRERLLRLDEQGRTAVPGAITDAQEWARLVADARNGFAHHLTGAKYTQIEDRLEEHLVLLGSLRWLLTGVLLLETGVTAEVLAQRLERHQNYRAYRQDAREWLPAVCSAPPDA